MKIKKVAAENYKGLDSIEIILKDRTQISGVNACGKTTVMDIVYDILTDKMSDGSSTQNVRPQGKDGHDLNGAPVVRSIVIEMDDGEYEIKKTTIKKMVKDRQTGEKVFKGNDTSFEVDGFPLKKKEFEKWMADRFNADVFTYCLNPKNFINLVAKNTSDGRKFLMNISKYDPEGFIGKNPKYAGISAVMQGHTPEEVKTVYRKRLRNIDDDITRTTQSIDLIKNAMVEIPDVSTVDSYRIDIQDKQTKITEIDKKVTKLEEYSDKALALKMKLGTILNEANKELIQRKSNLYKAIEELKASHYQTDTEIREYGTRNVRLAQNIRELEADIRSYAERLQKVSALTMSEKEKVCPTCGQTLKKSQINDRIKDFEAKKAAEFDMVMQFTKEAEESKDNYKKEININNEHIELLKARLKPIEDQMTILQNQVRNLPETKEGKDIPEYGAVERMIADYEKNLAEIPKLRAEKTSLENYIMEVSRKSKEAELEYNHAVSQNQINDKMISDKQDALKQLRQEYADTVKTIAMISEFSIESNKDMQDQINKFFKHFQFELFDTTQDGNVTETCRMTVNGIPYGKGLNHGDMILTEIDLAQGFQKMMGVEMPVFVDDTESVDEARIPDVGTQLITLRRTDDPKLTVTYGEE